MSNDARPLRASTFDNLSQDPQSSQQQHLARSEDLTHARPLPSRPNSPATTAVKAKSSEGTPSVPSQFCSACLKSIHGPFVRALGTVYHLNCFKCMDCGDVVASKFFPIDGPDGKQYPLCERDYFRRLNLICAKCNMALRGSYITACSKKFHVEHFTCSLCSTLFGPQDSYYEHENDVYCHFHYSTRFATKCAGCGSAILKQFVEINRNSRDECWHPECYMINKFWNVKVATRRTSSIAAPDDLTLAQVTLPHEDEAQDTPSSLREKQARMEQQVYRIWTVLSAFEESSAACISDMLRQVSNGQYLDAIRMAEKFIVHVEVLFATVDDLEYQFALLSVKGMSHVREARMLCRKTVELFTLLSHTQETGARRMGMTQELLALVTGLAHYLKILIRIALTGALKLEREYNCRDAMTSFLDKLHLLAVQGANPAARRMIKGANGEVMRPDVSKGNYGTQCVTYGFRSLAPENAGDSPFSPMAVGPSTNGITNKLANNPPSDLCVKCKETVEEDCVRLGTYQRWHSSCIQCAHCGKVAAVPVQKETQAQQQSSKSGDEKESNPGSVSAYTSQQPPPPSAGSSKTSTIRRPPPNVHQFLYDPSSMKEIPSFGEVPTVILCSEHAHQGCKAGFQAVQRLEQYAFLLNVALRRLYLLLKKQGVVPVSPVTTGYDQQQLQYQGSDTSSTASSRDPYKSAYLDRKLSATARLPKRSTIVESPAKTPDSAKEQRFYDGMQVQGMQQVSGSSGYGYGNSSAGSSGPGYHSGSTTPYRPPLPSQNQAAQTQQYQQQQQRGGAPSSYDNASNLSSGANSGDYGNDPYPPPPSSSHFSQQQHTQYAGSSQYSQSQHSQSHSPSQYSQSQHSSAPPQSQPSYPPPSPRQPPYQYSNHQRHPKSLDDGITLADIPQLMEEAQAREQHRSLPRESSAPFIAELSPLELAIVKHCAVLVLARSPLKDNFDLDEILEMVEMKKGGFWNKLFKGGDRDKKGLKKKGVFGVPLELLVEREGADSMLGATRVTMRVPSFIDDVISAMRTMDLSIEGIFRKNGNIRRLKDLTEAIDRDPSSVDLTQDNPVQLAALLKKFLRDLPDPLLTFKLHKLFIASQNLPSDDDRKRYLHMISLLLPKSHRDTMEVLFVFLKWVASFAHMDAETGSKMDVTNLATVICPSILYARGRDALRDETFGALKVVTALLEQQDEFFLVPEEFLAILHDQEYFANSLDLPSKEFLKRCDTYMRVKGGRPMPGTPYNGPTGGNNGVPRYPPLNSPTMERPPPIGMSTSERSGRPSPNLSNHGHDNIIGSAQSHNDYYSNPPRSPSSSHVNMQAVQRTPPVGGNGGPTGAEQWNTSMLQQQQLQHAQSIVAPRPTVGVSALTSSRPSSVVGSRTPVNQDGRGMMEQHPHQQLQQLHIQQQQQQQHLSQPQPQQQQQQPLYGSPNGYTTPLRQRA